jgi:apolipoprotein N-acyltransferase
MLKLGMINYKWLFLGFFSSIFLYLYHFGIEYKVLDTIFALMFVYTLFSASKKELLLGGFLTGVLWFWWLGFSFIYYELSYLIPLVIFGVGAVYAVLFYFTGLVNNLIYKVAYLFILSYINPFGFNWFKIELVFINSYLGTSKAEFLAILTVTALFIYLQRTKKIYISLYAYSIPLVVLFFINTIDNNTIKEPDLNIYMNTTDVEQDKKWDKKYKKDIVISNLEAIDTAVEKGYDLIIFPETSFPVVLNRNDYIKDILLEKSKEISIIAGALNQKEGLLYNSSYLFNKGKMEIANKVVLVPFGEAVPLPEKLRDLINDAFFNGAEDYEVAKNPTTFDINGIKFRNAICYEATTDRIFEQLDTSYMIAISNNAWFTPSHQPSLQRLLLRYYGRKYNVKIYSVNNKSKSSILN